MFSSAFSKSLYQFAEEPFLHDDKGFIVTSESLLCDTEEPFRQIKTSETVLQFYRFRRLLSAFMVGDMFDCVRVYVKCRQSYC